MRSIKTENGTVYVSDAEYQAHQLINQIGWREYCALMGIEPDKDPKARAARLRALGFDWQTVADCLQVTVTTLQRWLVESPTGRDKRRKTKRRYEQRVNARKAAERDAKWMRPSEVARLWQVTPETIRCAIRENRLEAVNIAPSSERPTYRIDRATLPTADKVLRYRRKTEND